MIYLDNASTSYPKPPEVYDFVDSAQSVGLVDIDMSKETIDFLVFAGHKTLFSIFGCSGVYSKKKCRYITNYFWRNWH